MNTREFPNSILSGTLVSSSLVAIANKKKPNISKWAEVLQIKILPSFKNQIITKL